MQNGQTLQAQQEIELFALIMQGMKDGRLTDEEVEQIDTAFANSCLKKCTFEALKKKAFKKYVTPHLYHTRITDTQIAILMAIGLRLGLEVDCLYGFTGQPRRRVRIF